MVDDFGHLLDFEVIIVVDAYVYEYAYDYVNVTAKIVHKQFVHE
jgi:hypothetical protein